MSLQKSKKYSAISGLGADDVISAAFSNNQLIGIFKDNSDGVPKVQDPNGSIASIFKASDESLNAFNIAVYGKDGVTDEIALASNEELTKFFNEESNKESNEQFIAPELSTPIAALPKRERTAPATVLSYPLDIDINQDHLKINRFKYKRPDTGVQASRPPEFSANLGYLKRKGDSVKGTSYGKYQGGVILPMPKVSDSNGAQWGESDLDVFSLGIVSAGQQIGNDTVKGIDALSSVFRGDGIGAKEKFGDFFKKAGINFDFGKTGGDLKNLGIAGGGIFASTIAKAAGINIGADEFLARSGGRILNPNAELLFQGPVLRDFAFKFLMIARSKKEGETIRRIIRWFKTGAAPVFNDRALLQTPSIFQLTYGRGQGNSDYFLPTVNKFNEMALRNITVDYAPDGFWSAYQDSQPVAVVVSLQFTELRPVYKQDQDYAATQNDTSVGY